MAGIFSGGNRDFQSLEGGKGWVVFRGWEKGVAGVFFTGGDKHLAGLGGYRGRLVTPLSRRIKNIKKKTHKI